MAGKPTVPTRADRRRERDRREMRATAFALLHVAGYCLLIAAALYLCGFAAFLVFA